MFRPTRFAMILGAAAGVSFLVAPASAAAPTDVTPPIISLDGRKFVIGTQIEPASDDPADFCPFTTAPLDLYWHGSDDESGIEGYRLSRSFSPPVFGNWEVIVPGTTQTKFRTSAEDWDCQTGGNNPIYYRVVARDLAGNTAEAVDDFFDIGVWREDGTNPNRTFPLTVNTTGVWQTDDCSCYDGGHTTYSTTAGASISYTTNSWRGGRWVALVMPKDVDRGEVSIAIDDNAPVTVDSFASHTRNATVVWQHKFIRRGMHTITITNLGTAGRSRIDVDSLLQTWD